MNDNSRSPIWAIINWAIVSDKVRRNTTITPNHATIDEAIQILEQKYDSDELLLLEAEELEKQLIQTIIDLLYKKHAKEIKRNLAHREKERRLKAQQLKNTKFDVKIVPFGKMKDLKDMGFDLDPDTLNELSQNIMDQLFKKKKKKDEEDEDSDDDPGASFYL
ncbi:hypothetical protein [Candidatus Harpocratesius sp.]